MKNIIYCLVIGLGLSHYATAQTQINNSVPFQTDDSKDYSIVIPSSYVDGEPIAAFLALHPWNTDRWNGQTWCEELAEFAEANDVILVCPDGGDDGKIDDPIDTAFTSFILDSAFQWYDIDPDKLYAVGFSWGGKTTYTYGLNHIDKFAGLMPIGAAVNITEVSNISDHIEGKPVYVIHGSFDTPNIRYYPLIDEMETKGACIESNLLQGVGHTIDFDNQLEILTTGYDYLKDNACVSTSTEDVIDQEVKLLPYNSIRSGSIIELNYYNWTIMTLDGKTVKVGNKGSILLDIPAGHYIFSQDAKTELFRVVE